MRTFHLTTLDLQITLPTDVKIRYIDKETFRKERCIPFPNFFAHTSRYFIKDILHIDIVLPRLPLDLDTILQSAPLLLRETIYKDKVKKYSEQELVEMLSEWAFSHEEAHALQFTNNYSSLIKYIGDKFGYHPYLKRMKEFYEKEFDYRKLAHNEEIIENHAEICSTAHLSKKGIVRLKDEELEKLFDINYDWYILIKDFL